MKEFKLTLTVNEVNTILKALGAMPYNQVSELIGKIHGQAQVQLTNAVISETAQPAEKDLTDK